MKTVILAGGFGKRLKPLTNDTPKPMLKILDIPIIGRQIAWLKSFNLTEFIICAGYKREKIVEYLGNGSAFGVKVDYSFEEKTLDTAGALKQVKDKVGKEFFVANGDILTNLDPLHLVGVGPAIAAVQLRSTFGVIDIDDTNSKVIGFREKPIVENLWINAGLYYFTDDVFSYLPDTGSLEKIVLPVLAKERKLNVHKYTKVYWKSIDSHKDIEEAEKELSENKILISFKSDSYP